MQLPTYRQVVPLLLAAGLGLVFSPGCSKEKENPTAGTDGSPVLATVGGTTITVDALLAEAERRRSKRQPVLSKEDLLNRMVEREALLFRAMAAKIDEEQEIRRAIDNLIIGELRQRELHDPLKGVAVSDEEVRSVYEAEGERLTSPARVRLSILVLKAGENASDEKKEEVRQRMIQARELALNGEPPSGRGPAAKGFGSLAVEFSDDQVSRYRGGDAGWFESGRTGSRWPAEVVEAGQALAQGAISEVIEVQGDFYLAMKTNTMKPVLTNFEAAATAIHRRLLVEKREALEASFHKKNAELAEVRVETAALARVELPSSTLTAKKEDDLRPPTLPAGGTN